MNYRTDLALERRELIKDRVPNGVNFDEEIDDNIKITRIFIENREGERAIGKPIGDYITVEAKTEFMNPFENHKEAEIIAEEIERMIPKKDGCVLVVGLGNKNITPDAIGPRVVDKTLCTRHIAKDISLRETAAVATGAMGQTGIETAEIIKGICENISVSCIIAVDALASVSTNRLCKTVQICNTGISPGSGVNNKRTEISEKTMGVPVIAVGVPTVVDAAYIVSESGGDESRFKGFMVTPRDIDSLVNSVSNLLALSIGKAIQPSLSISDLYCLTM